MLFRSFMVGVGGVQAITHDPGALLNEVARSRCAPIKQGMVSPRLFLRGIGSVFLLLLAACQAPMPQVAQPQMNYGGPFMLGVDVLASRGFDLIRGKRVGLITNHTSLTSRGERTRSVMQRALGPNFVALYAPEHGKIGRAHV